MEAVHQPSSQRRVSFAPGGRFRDYVLVDRLGSGGMAEVWVARRQGAAGFAKRVVLKRIHDQMVDDPDLLNLFLDEARVAARLQHPNAVHVYDLLEQDGVWCIVMEYIPGRSLGDLLRRLRKKRVRMTPRAAVSIAVQVCEGLEHAHNATDDSGRPLCLVHRDVTPQNILIAASGNVQIIDFGIAWAASRLARSHSGIVRGTPYYMAPEQARGDAVDRRTDVYGMGAVLYEALTGRKPFAGLAMPQILLLLYRGDRPEHLLGVRDSIPPDLAEIVWRAMSPDPAARHPTAAALHATLAGWLEGAGGLVDARRLAGTLQSAFPEGVDVLTAQPAASVPAPLAPPTGPAATSIEMVDSRPTLIDTPAPVPFGRGPLLDLAVVLTPPDAPADAEADAEIEVSSAVITREWEQPVRTNFTRPHTGVSGAYVQPGAGARAAAPDARADFEPAPSPAEPTIAVTATGAASRDRPMPAPVLAPPLLRVARIPTAAFDLRPSTSADLEGTMMALPGELPDTTRRRRVTTGPRRSTPSRAPLLVAALALALVGFIAGALALTRWADPVPRGQVTVTYTDTPPPAAGQPTVNTRPRASATESTPTSARNQSRESMPETSPR